MVIVIIHWKIHRNAEARRLFLKNWRECLEIDNREELVGEFLSAPLSEVEAKFPCTVLNTQSSSLYESYFNVGIWKSIESFREAVIDESVGIEPKTEPFEYEYRERMILSP